MREIGLGRGAVEALGAQLVGGASRLLTAVLVARLLGPAAFGVYSLATVAVAIVFNLGSLGITSSATYAIAGAASPALAVAEVRKVGRRIAVLNVAVAGVLMLALRDVILPGVPTEVVLAALVAIVPYLYNNLAAAIFLGLQRYRTYSVIVASFYVVTGFSAVVVAVVTGSARWTVVAWAIGAVAVAAVCERLVAKVSAFRAEVDQDAMARLLSFGWRAHLSNVATFLNYRLDLLLIGIYMTTAAAGSYAATVVVGEAVWLLSSVASSLLFAGIAGMKSRIDEGRRIDLTEKVGRLVLAGSTALAVLVGLLAPRIMSTIFGNAFVDVAGTLRVLLVGVVALSLSRILASHIAAVGRPELNIPGSVVGVALNVVLNILWIPVHGTLGAAMASAVSYLFILAYRILTFELLRPSGRPRRFRFLFVRRKDVSELIASIRRS